MACPCPSRTTARTTTSLTFTLNVVGSSREVSSAELCWFTACTAGLGIETCAGALWVRAKVEPRKSHMTQYRKPGKNLWAARGWDAPRGLGECLTSEKLFIRHQQSGGKQSSLVKESLRVGLPSV